MEEDPIAHINNNYHSVVDDYYHQIMIMMMVVWSINMLFTNRVAFFM